MFSDSSKKGIARWVVIVVVYLLLVPLNNNTPTPVSGQSGAAYWLATTNVSDDGFIFYDVETGETLEHSFGNIDHILGDFSPDGCQFVFSLERDPSNYDLFIADIEGTNLRQVLFPGRLAALNYRAFEPEWSPNGEHIAFTFMRYYDPPDEAPYRRTHIAIVSVDGGALGLYSSSGYEFQPRWSPDGTRLAYVSEQPILFDAAGNPIEITADNEDDVPRYPEIWIGNVAGTEKNRLTNLGEVGAFNPRWSPDGTRLAYVIQPFENSHRLLVNNLETGSVLALNRDLVTVLDYDWQQDGAGIAAAIQGMQDVPQNQLWQLDIVHHGDAAAQHIAETAAYLDYPRFSPDGRWLAFRSEYELAVMNIETGETHYLGPTTRHNNPPVWSPAKCDSP